MTDLEILIPKRKKTDIFKIPRLDYSIDFNFKDFKSLRAAVKDAKNKKYQKYQKNENYF